MLFKVYDLQDLDALLKCAKNSFITKILLIVYQFIHFHIHLDYLLQQTVSSVLISSFFFKDAEKKPNMFTSHAHIILC